ncbi:MAG: ester cyclase [Chromatiales bacterium]
MNTSSLFTRSLFVLFAVGLLAASGCATQGGSTGAGAGSIAQSHKAYKEAWDRHDVGAIVAQYGQSGTLDTPATGGKVQGEALAQWLGALFTAIPDLHVDILSSNVSGDTLREEWVIKGTWTQPFPGGPLAGAKPSGRSFTVPGSGFYRYQDNRIVAGRHYFDNMSFLTQLGVIPPPGQSQTKAQ